MAWAICLLLYQFFMVGIARRSHRIMGDFAEVLLQTSVQCCILIVCRVGNQRFLIVYEAVKAGIMQRRFADVRPDIRPYYHW